MNPYNIINFISKNRPEKYSKEKIKEISNLLPVPIEGESYENENGLQGKWKRKIDTFDDDDEYGEYGYEISTYKNNIKNGPYELYHPNGKLKSKQEYLNGELNGVSEKYYYDNGKLYVKEEYLNGEKNGIWEYYHDNGQLASKQEYLNGKLNGTYESYYGNDQIRSKGKFLNGRPNGIWEEYYRNGQIRSKQEFLNGKLISDQKY